MYPKLDPNLEQSPRLSLSSPEIAGVYHRTQFASLLNQFSQRQSELSLSVSICFRHSSSLAVRTTSGCGHRQAAPRRYPKHSPLHVIVVVLADVVLSWSGFIVNVTQPRITQ